MLHREGSVLIILEKVKDGLVVEIKDHADVIAMLEPALHIHAAKELLRILPPQALKNLDFKHGSPAVLRNIADDFDGDIPLLRAIKALDNAAISALPAKTNKRVCKSGALS